MALSLRVCCAVAFTAAFLVCTVCSRLPTPKASCKIHSAIPLSYSPISTIVNPPRTSFTGKAFTIHCQHTEFVNSASQTMVFTNFSQATLYQQSVEPTCGNALTAPSAECVNSSTAIVDKISSLCINRFSVQFILQDCLNPQIAGSFTYKMFCELSFQFETF